MVDAVGTTKYTYTTGGQLLTEDGPFASDTVTNTYANRQRTKLVLGQPTGVWTNAFAFDEAGRLTNVTSSAGAFSYSYDSVHPSLINKLTLPPGSAITNQFDSVARLLATHLRTSAGTMTNKHEYLYNSASQRTNETRSDASTVAYRYDNIGQLKVADSSVNSEDRGYTYDAAWNLNYRTNNGVSSFFQVDVKNELTNASTPILGQSYDDNGNLITSQNSKVLYTYDDENRLIEWGYYANGVGSPTDGDKKTDFVYDGLGRLRIRREWLYGAPSIAQQVDGPVDPNWQFLGETDYIYDGLRVIQERDGDNNPLVSYTRGKDLSGSLQRAGGIGGLLARSSGYSSGNFTSHAFYHSEGNGNITFMLGTSESMVARYRFDPFGNTISKTGSLADANVYRFSSKEIHVNSGMYYYLYRFYDPNLQRWINRDPINERGGLNLYGFVLNAPHRFVDSFGLAILVNNTTNPVVASGDPGVGPTGNGVGGPPIYVIVPPGGTCGGGANPMCGYPSLEQALAMYDNPSLGLPSAGELFDVDYVDFGNGPEKIPGDLEGPTVTVVDATTVTVLSPIWGEGEICVPAHTVTSPTDLATAYIRWLRRPLSWLGVHFYP